MARSISSTLLAAQKGSGATPYIRLVFTDPDSNETDYSSRLLQLEHREEPYHEEATLILRNDDLAISDLTGQWVEIGYGHTTGSGNEYSSTARLWVKSYLPISLEGKLIVILHLEGMWTILSEQLLLIGDPPLYSSEYSTNTIYEIIGAIFTELSEVTGAPTFTLDALGDQDDGIINDFNPKMGINDAIYEDMNTIIQTLMAMTKCYLRPEASLQFKVVYPQTIDSNNEEYYSYQAHYFLEYDERVNLLVPNHIVVYANAPDGDWASAYDGGTLITAESGDAGQEGRYMRTTEIHLAETITDWTDAGNRAAAIATKYKADLLAGRLIVPHDCRVELYDKVRVYDTRGM